MKSLINEMNSVRTWRK